ncbi:unnamed protein product [Laminaria digitata]
MSHDIVHNLKTFAAALLVSAIAFGTTTAIASPSASQQALGEPVPELSLRRQVTVDQNSIRLGDLFDGPITGVPGVSADTVVAYAPQPGRRAIFDADWLSRMAYRYRLNWRPATRVDRAIVQRTSTIVSGDSIAVALGDALAQRGYGDDYEVSLSNRNLLIHIDSKMPATVDIVNLSVDLNSEQFNAVIAVPAGDPNAQRHNVTGRLFAMIEVPVPVAILRPGEAIRSDDVKWMAVRARSVRDTIVTDMDDLISMEPRRALRQHTPIRLSDLRQPLDVEKGNVVTMTFETPGMTLSATGVSEQNGIEGDIIRVRNSQTKLVIDARVTGPDRVAVQILPQLAANQGATK